MSMCDSCVNFEYDENDEEYYCSASMDEDDYVRFITSPEKICPFYRLDDEYAVVRASNVMRNIYNLDKREHR